LKEDSLRLVQAYQARDDELVCFVTNAHHLKKVLLVLASKIRLLCGQRDDVFKV